MGVFGEVIQEKYSPRGLKYIFFMTICREHFMKHFNMGFFGEVIKKKYSPEA
jgi:hypothetical protein